MRTIYIKRARSIFMCLKIIFVEERTHCDVLLLKLKLKAIRYKSSDLLCMFDSCFAGLFSLACLHALPLSMLMSFHHPRPIGYFFTISQTHVLIVSCARFFFRTRPNAFSSIASFFHLFISKATVFCIVVSAVIVLMLFLLLVIRLTVCTHFIPQFSTRLRTFCVCICFVFFYCWYSYNL